MKVVSCETCEGWGMRQATEMEYPVVTCPDCNGVGELEVVDPAGPPEVVDHMEEVRRLCR